jgi:hypothetical protein
MRRYINIHAENLNKLSCMHREKLIINYLDSITCFYFSILKKLYKHNKIKYLYLFYLQINYFQYFQIDT